MKWMPSAYYTQSLNFSSIVFKIYSFSNFDHKNYITMVSVPKHEIIYVRICNEEVWAPIQYKDDILPV